jgi:hypothetical protein
VAIKGAEEEGNSGYEGEEHFNCFEKEVGGSESANVDGEMIELKRV